MHHYGEDSVEVSILGDEFRIIIRNKVTGAEIKITGPIRGLYEQPQKIVEQRILRNLGEDLSHKLRNL